MPAVARVTNAAHLRDGVVLLRVVILRFRAFSLRDGIQWDFHCVMPTYCVHLFEKNLLTLSRW
jgi:hypothetical protein